MDEELDEGLNQRTIKKEKKKQRLEMAFIREERYTRHSWVGMWMEMEMLDLSTGIVEEGFFGGTVSQNSRVAKKKNGQTHSKR